MSQAAPHSDRPISLDHLIALSDEIAALVRAGVPLEKTLARLGGDLPGQLGSIARDLAQRLERGESLPQAIETSGRSFPPVCRAVLQAGIKSGRLSSALEALAGSARQLAQLRRVVSMAMLYPLIVLLLAYGLFALFVARLLPAFSGLFGKSPPLVVQLLSALGRRVDVWGPIGPIVIVLVAAWWWYQSSRSLMLQQGRSAVMFGWLPGVGRVVRTAQAASLSQVLGLLLEHEVPLPEAIELAASTAGDRRVVASANQIAAGLRQGGPFDAEAARRGGFPPFVAWLIAGGRRHNALVPLLKHTAESYQRRAMRQADWLRLYLPMIVTVAIGGTATLLYGLSLFLPLTKLLEQLARPVAGSF